MSRWRNGITWSVGDSEESQSRKGKDVKEVTSSLVPDWKWAVYKGSISAEDHGSSTPLRSFTRLLNQGLSS